MFREARCMAQSRVGPVRAEEELLTKRCPPKIQFAQYQIETW